VFERFTERARQAIVLAQEEARGLQHGYIGTEHLLLGLLREEEGVAARVLGADDVTVEEVRKRVADVVGQGIAPEAGQIPFTPRAKRALELSLREALALGHSYIGTEHVLLGLLHAREGVAARILLEYGVDGDNIRGKIVRRHGMKGPSPSMHDVSMQVAQFQLGRGPIGSQVSWFTLRIVAVPMVLGAALFGIGLLVGWLIWA
jgi:ATP-dependent Clp protease ATP-binding subunit ClpC